MGWIRWYDASEPFCIANDNKNTSHGRFMGHGLYKSLIPQR